jgi:hypothetical protein
VKLIETLKILELLSDKTRKLESLESAIDNLQIDGDSTGETDWDVTE